MSDKLVSSEASLKDGSEKAVQQEESSSASANGIITNPRPIINEKRAKASSCPPIRCRSINSGPWSLDWLTQISHEEVVVVFSSKLQKVDKKKILPVKLVGKKKNQW